jgi:A/G-specific adenine glycosylase
MQRRQLPGIGKYTAHAVATFAFNRSVPIVEANTARVLTRLFNFSNSIDCNAARQELWQKAAILVPKRNARIYNSALTDLGALICIPHQPKCGICPVKKFCRAKHPQTLPARNSRRLTKRLTENYAFVAVRNRILLEQSPGRWRGMWILPPMRNSRANQQPIYESTFPFTNHQISLRVYLRCREEFNSSSQRWIRFDSLDQIPIPSPHRRALNHLLATRISHVRLHR